jgi:hypothetical protein
MAPRQRIVLLIIAAVILVAGIALAASSGGDDGEEEAGDTTPPAQTQAPAADGETTGQPTTPQPPPPRVETIRIRDGAPVGGEQELRYERGDTIRLRFVSDAAGEVHIHGFDRYVQVGPSPKTARFRADLEGIFEVEDHGSGEVLAMLEIRPK